MKLVSKIVLMAAMLMGSFAQAGSIPGPEFRNQLSKSLSSLVLQKMVKEANTPNSAVRKILEQHDIEDGRNGRGTINLPLSAKDIQVTLLDGGEYNQCNLEGCTGTEEGMFMVTVASMQGVHRGATFSGVTLLFSAESSVLTDENEKVTRSVKVEFVKELKIDLY
ncbi:hypothetical protein [Bdellovibrio sp. HCB209]|uniref:hypothetical protein n=1 Tax=Bdellovibrio sp. HCB209 TaxID=3394354 RepID=UPI0039B64D60